MREETITNKLLLNLTKERKRIKITDNEDLIRLFMYHYVNLSEEIKTFENMISELEKSVREYPSKKTSVKHFMDKLKSNDDIYERIEQELRRNLAIIDHSDFSDKLKQNKEIMKYQELATKYNDLYAYMNEKQAILKAQEQELIEQRKNNAELRQQLFQQNEKYDREVSTGKQLQMENRILQQKLELTRDVKTEELEQDKSNLQAELELMHKQVKRLESEHRKNKRQIEKLVQSQNTEEVYQLNEKLIETQRLLMMRENNIEQLHEQIARQEQGKQETKQIEQMRAELTESQQQVYRYESQFSALQTKLSDYEQLQNQVELDQHKFADLASDFKAKTSKLTSLEVQNAELQIKLDYYEYLNNKESSLNKQEESFAEFAQNYQNQSEQVADLEDESEAQLLLDEEFELDQDGELALRLLQNKRIPKLEFKKLLSQEQEFIGSFVSRVNGMFEEEYDLELIICENDHYFINDEVKA